MVRVLSGSVQPNAEASRLNGLSRGCTELWAAPHGRSCRYLVLLNLCPPPNRSPESWDGKYAPTGEVSAVSKDRPCRASEYFFYTVAFSRPGSNSAVFRVTAATIDPDTPLGLCIAAECLPPQNYFAEFCKSDDSPVRRLVVHQIAIVDLYRPLRGRIFLAVLGMRSNTASSITTTANSTGSFFEATAYGMNHSGRARKASLDRVRGFVRGAVTLDAYVDVVYDKRSGIEPHLFYSDYRTMRDIWVVPTIDVAPPCRAAKHRGRMPPRRYHHHRQIKPVQKSGPDRESLAMTGCVAPARVFTQRF